jgi:hypothetical protein
MNRSRHLSATVVLASLAWLAAFDNSSALAQRSKTGLSPENQKKYDELMQSARRNQTFGALAVQVGAGFLGLGCLWAAYSTYRKGLKITEGKRLEGLYGSTFYP